MHIKLVYQYDTINIYIILITKLYHFLLKNISYRHDERNLTNIPSYNVVDDIITYTC